MLRGLGALRNALRNGGRSLRAPRVATRITGRVLSPAPSLLARSFSSEFLTGANNAYLEEMYDLWQKDPSSVHKSWDVYFRTGQSAHVPNSNSGVVTNVDVAAGGASNSQISTDFRVMSLIRAYRSRGHEVAKLNPLDDAPEQSLLSIENFGFSEADRDMPIENLSAMGLIEDARLLHVADDNANKDGTTTLGELVDFLKKTYTGEAAYEISHINDPIKSTWLKERVEIIPEPLASDYQRKMVKHLALADRFERFLAKRFNTAKRFGVEGLETLIPGLNAVLDEAAVQGVTNVVLGMAHRGRLNVLTNVMRKPFELVFQEFHGILESPHDWSGTGDVKYHLGTSGDYTHEESNNTVHLTLLPNPSHLEAVNTVVLGKARAKMDFYGDNDGDKVLPILLHGDAAFAGQGIAYETMQLAKLKNYHTGGSLHIVTNNQVGFTTNPEDSRSTLHPSDIAKAFNAPVFHVNADNLFEVCRIFKLATEYRQEFRTDVVINLLGYRRYGHNELDQPSFTQPTLYSKIDKHPPVMDSTVANLVSTGKFKQEELDSMLQEVEALIEKSFDDAEGFVSPHSPWLSGKWLGMKGPATKTEYLDTGVSADVLASIGRTLVDIPSDIKLHRQLKRIMKDKAERLEATEQLDWGTVEGLAFGSLLREGINVRISGQDAQRGTFSHRHCVLHDQETDNQFCPLQHIQGNHNSLFTAANSPLSEYGVLGFELGYSMEDPHRLTIWEAQFGDFTNGAQIIIDQFISAMENKWYRQSGLVMLLPHGYQGLGPEHSSCRIERFLQCSAEDPRVILPADEQLQACNWQIANPTTPANYFHLLRRQIHRQFRKPLIVASTKNLLRHKLAHSSFADLTEGTKFHRVFSEAFSDEITDDDKVKRLLICSGKLYYELLEERRATERDDVAIVRIEQLSPFPSDRVAEEVARYPNADLVWAQEEPMNMGAWQFMEPRISEAVKQINGKEIRPRYVGRGPMASTAEGTSHDHTEGQRKLIEEAFNN